MLANLGARRSKKKKNWVLAGGEHVLSSSCFSFMIKKWLCSINKHCNFCKSVLVVTCTTRAEFLALFVTVCKNHKTLQSRSPKIEDESLTVPLIQDKKTGSKAPAIVLGELQVSSHRTIKTATAIYSTAICGSAFVL